MSPLTYTEVLSVNVAAPGSVRIGGRSVASGIDKRPVPSAQVGPHGLSGDRVQNRKHHGGPDQAAYLLTSEDTGYWERELGRTLPPGTFGENLNLDGPTTAGLRVGDRLHLGGGGPGDVVLEVTAPRIPCATLAAHLNEPDFVRRFARAGRPGAYVRALRGGEVRPGMEVRLEVPDPQAPTLGELFFLWYDKSPSPQRLRELLEYPLAARLRTSLEERLARLE